MKLTPPVPDTRGGGVSENGEYCIVVGWDAEAAAARFHGFFGLLHAKQVPQLQLQLQCRGRGQAPRVPWLYGAVLYGWAEHIKLRSAAEADVCI